MTEPELDPAAISTLYRVTVRLPPFWPEKLTLWFAQVEVLLELAGISSQRTKFNQVVAQLNQQRAAEV